MFMQNIRYSIVAGIAFASVTLNSYQAVAQNDRFFEIEQAISVGDYDKAIADLNSLNASGDLAVKKYLLLSEIYLKTGAGLPAEAAIERARRFGADYAATSVLYAKALLLQARYSETLEALRGVTIPDEYKTASFIVSGDASFALRRYDNARSDYQQAIALDDTGFEPYLGLSRLELRQGSLQDASDLAEEANKRAPENTMVQFTRGLIAKYQGNIPRAEELFLMSLDLFEGNLMSNLELASIMIGKGENIQAEQYLDTVYAMSPNQPMALYLSGVIAASNEAYEDADVLLNRSRQIVDNFLPAMYVRGLVSYQLGRYLEAIEYLERVYKVRPNNKTTRVALAGAYIKVRKDFLALNIIKPMLETAQGSQDTALWSMAATAAMSAGQLEDGRKYLQKIADLGGEKSGAVLSGFDSKLALATYADGAPERALATFSSAIAGKDAQLRELGVLGSMQLRAKDYDGAEITIKRIVETAPERALGYNMQGTLEYQRKNYTAAASAYTEAINRNAEYFSALRNRALSYFRLDKLNEAERDLKRLLDLQPNDTRSKAVLGKTLLAQDKAREAVDYFREAIRSYPKAAELSADYATAMALAGITTRAIEQARITTILASEKPALLKRMGLLLLELKQAAAAERPLSRHAAFKPDSGDAHLLHARALLHMGLYTGSRISFERASTAKNDKPDRDVLNWYLFASQALGQRFREANKILPTLIASKRPEDVLPGIVGNLLFDSGELIAAEEVFKAILKENPTDDVVIGLAKTLKEQDKQTEATDILRDYVTKQPDSRVVRSLLGQFYEEIGDDERAEQQYEIILRAGVVDAEIAAKLAVVYLRQGNKLSSRLAERAYLILPEDPYILDVYGWVLLQANRDTAKSIEALTKAVRKAPSNALYKYHLGMAYLAQGSRSRARRFLTQAINLDDTFEGASEAKRQIQLLDY